MNRLRRLTRAAVFAGCLAVMALLPAAASAAGPVLSIHSTSNTVVAPGSEFGYWVDTFNKGTAATDGSAITIHGVLPEDVTFVAGPGPFPEGQGLTCSSANPGNTEFTCSSNATVGVGEFVGAFAVRIIVAVDPGAAPGNRTAEFTAEGGGAAPASTFDSTRIEDEPAAFGIDAFDFMPAADAAGTPESAAASHPYVVDSLVSVATWKNQLTGPLGELGGGERDPVEPVRDIEVDLPPGFVGYGRNLAQCALTELAHNETITALPLCAEESQVGTITLGSNNQYLPSVTPGLIPVYNLEPPPGVPARFGFNAAGTIVVLDASVRSGSDYGVTLGSRRISGGLTLISSELHFWGTPAAAGHDGERACKGQGAPVETGHPSCGSEAPETAFIRMPTSCTPAGAGLPLTARVDSWYHPDSFDTRTIHTHAPPGQPLAPEDWGPELGIEDCDQVPFEPALSVAPTTKVADSPSGLEAELSIPQDQDPDQLDQSDLRKAVITLPPGMVVNPASASGLGACTTAQVGMLTPVGATRPEFTPDPAQCPDNSKIGSVEIETPALDHPLSGSVYLANQGDNPFGSLLAMYLTVDDAASGVVLKLPGRIDAAADGQVVTTFDENPQLPFEHLQVKLFGGPRAALRTPSTCGTYTTHATLTPWSGNPPVDRSSSFRISQCGSGGFDPKLSGGTQTPRAGSYSPFTLRVNREDGSQELGSLQVTLPPGLVGSLRGYTYCPDAVLAAISSDLGTGKGEEASPSCPVSSRVGSVSVAAGSGSDPFESDSGRAYIAGPYRGDPVSLAVVAPAVAGPFDLGSVVVRNAIHVDPTTAQLTIDSDPLPTILHGIPLDLRDVRVKYDTTVNPTSCEPFEITSKLVSTTGATASPSQHYQAAACDRLGFKPRLSLKLSGPTHRAAHPALRAVLRTRPGDANIGRSTVLLPKTELLENAHIRTICTRVQYSAGGGEGAGCPKGSIYGYARAWTPLLDQPLQGPVYLRSNGGERELPDLVASLTGQIHIELVGYIDALHARIRTRFLNVPDAPVDKFELTMQGGKKGLLANNTNICRAKPKATLSFGGQNGKVLEAHPAVKAICGSGRSSHKRR